MMTQSHRARALTSLRAISIGFVVAFAFAACGSETSSSEDGCEPQSTRECVGPGACKGGQSCDADRKWSACNCGTGGTGGTSGASGSGGSGGGGAPGGGGTGGTAGGTGGISGGTGGVSGGTGGMSGAGGTPSGGGTAGDASTGGASADASDATVDTGVGPFDDPCPTDPINVNCSNSCGPKSQDCSATCYMSSGVVSDSVAAAHYVVRTPSNPGLHAEYCAGCWGGDAGVQPVYWMRIQFDGVSGGGYKITVGKPWRVWAKNNTSLDGIGACLNDDKYGKGCDTTGYPTSPATFRFYIGTDDPSAPSRNVLIQKTSASCGPSDFWQ